MASNVPTHLLAALALTLGQGLLPCSLARAQTPANDADQEAAPPKLPPWSWETTPAHLRIAAALREARRASPNDKPQLLQRIVESGRDAIAAQVDILLRNRVPETNPKDGPQILSEVQRELLLSALGQMPANAVRKEIEARLAKTPDDREANLGAIHALGVVGEADDVAQLVALVPRKTDDPELALPFASRDTLRSATTTLLRRIPSAWPALATVLRKTDPSTARPLLDALGSTRDPRALGILLEVARTNAKLKWQAAGLAPRCGSSLNAELDRQFLEWVRNELPNAEPPYARTLLACVGALDDGAWVPTLIERLEDENSGIREEALGGLRRISGLAYPMDPKAWRTWYETETRWHTVQRPKLLLQFASAETPKVLAAVREYSQHRTRRGELADELLRVLEHSKPEVRIQVISVLEQLGSPVACPALLGLLRDDDKRVVEGAWRALRAISGIELPHDPDQLRELLARS
jgi:HEAT repeat protein